MAKGILGAHDRFLDQIQHALLVLARGTENSKMECGGIILTNCISSMVDTGILRSREGPLKTGTSFDGGGAGCHEPEEAENKGR